MAKFLPAFDRMLAHEGGYQHTNTPGDLGGETYAGIARNRNPQWNGWIFVDKREWGAARARVLDFYRAEFWVAIRGDDIASQGVAEALFDFAVNVGPGAAIPLAQAAAGAAGDGAIGPKTLAAWAEVDPIRFVERFTLARIAHYVKICKAKPAQRQWLYGWTVRSLSFLGGPYA